MQNKFMFFKNISKNGLKIAAIVVAISLTGFGCKGLTAVEQAAVKPVSIEYWSVFASNDAIQKTIEKYRVTHPQVNIDFRVFRPDEYETELVNALAEDRGPDIFSVEADMVGEYETKLLPMPESVTVPIVIGSAPVGVSGLPESNSNADVQVTISSKKTITTKKLKEIFVSVVGEDVILEVENAEKIFALPLSLDTLALFYNREILDKSGIPEPPKTWEAFVDGIKKLRRMDASTGALNVAAAGLGTATNIDRAQDILALLMMQNGAEMYDDYGRATFHLIPGGLRGRTIQPGVEALQFFTDFANPLNDKVYGWDKSLPSSFEMFARGQLAYFFGYSYHRDLLLARSPKLNYGIAPMPQLNNEPVNVANYWVEGVSKKTKHVDEAWDFLQFAATDINAVTDYLVTSERPTALRALVSATKEKQEPLVPFIDSVLSAHSWYKGSNKKAAERIFSNMVNAVNDARNNGRDVNFVKIINDGAVQVGATL